MKISFTCFYLRKFGHPLTKIWQTDAPDGFKREKWVVPMGKAD